MSEIDPRGGVSIFQISLKFKKVWNIRWGGGVKPIWEKVRNFPVFKLWCPPLLKRLYPAWAFTTLVLLVIELSSVNLKVICLPLGINVVRFCYRQNLAGASIFYWYTVWDTHWQVGSLNRSMLYVQNNNDQGVSQGRTIISLSCVSILCKQVKVFLGA